MSEPTSDPGCGQGGRPLADAEARRRICGDLGATLVVEAAAGTGKTTMLVARLVAVLQAGHPLDRVVAVTFTEKAAGEMKLRLRAEVERAREAAGTSAAQRACLDAALEKLEAARIGTIHSLCADLLRERPVEARVDPVFEVAAEDEARRLFEGAFDRWFQETLAAPPEGVRRLLRRRPRGRDDDGPRQALEDAGWRLAGHRDFPAPWVRRRFDRDPLIDALLGRLGELGALAARADHQEDWLVKSLAEVQRFVTDVAHRESVRERDHDGLEAELRDLGRQKLWGWKGRHMKQLGEGIERAEVVALRAAVKAELDQFVALADADLAACLHGELRPLIEIYGRLKARSGKLDFLDLLLRARDLVRDDAAVRGELQSRFSHVFVDEFQDTDPLQAEILLLLAADDPAEEVWTRARPVPGKLFIVGDPKQSIYRFRRADVALYEETKRRLLAAGAELVYLTTSFRSAPAIQGLVNAAFAPRMTGPHDRGQQAGYVALEPHRPELEQQPSVVALPVPRPYSERGYRVKYRIEESYPDAAAAFIDWLVTQSGWTVEERGRQVAVAARHVCILLKRFQSYSREVTRAYVEALEARRIKHVLVGGRSYHGKEEIAALRAALEAIEWPDDELAVFASLRGPFFALSDETLLAYRHRFRSLHPLRPHPAEEPLGEPFAAVAEALAVLGRLHSGRNRRPIADTIGRLLDATRAHAGIAIWPTGEQALANLLRMMDLARRFEAAGATSFRAFVERLQRDAERGDASDAPVVEEGTEGVRIMTVHRAKGLEFPVVVLADPTAKAVRETPTRWVDGELGLWAEPLAWCAPNELLENRDEALARDGEEAVRLAYVAATRARDLLVVPVEGDGGPGPGDAEEGEDWLDVLRPAVYPETAERRRPAAAPGCPPFGDDSVFERPSDCRYSTISSVKPGLHRPVAGSHPVVWWAPAALSLDKQHDVGLRQQQLLQADEGEVRSEAGARAHEAWQERRRQTIAGGSRPSLRVVSVTELSAAAEATVLAGSLPVPEPVTLEETAAARFGRPHGKRFGSLVHALLSVVELGAGAAAVGRAAEVQGRIVGAPAEEVAAAVEVARAALGHPLLRRAAGVAGGDCRREAPLLLRQEDGSLVEGVVDLAFREVGAGGAAWTVVDFKTDVELGQGRARYEEQVRLYARAIAAATGEPATGVLLRV